MNLAHWLVRAAKGSPDNPALLRGTKLVADYREFARRAASIAASLQVDFGILPGDRISIFAKNDTRYLEVLYGIWFAGAVAVPINAKLHAREAQWIIENSESRLLFVEDNLQSNFISNKPACIENTVVFSSPQYSELRKGNGLATPVSRSMDDTAWLFYTSGTTGRPKGVMISNGNIHAMVFSYLADIDEVSSKDAALYAAPISHGAGLYNFQHVIKAARHVVPCSAGFNPAEILELAPKLGNVHMFAAPTMVRRLIDHAKSSGLKGEGIRTIIYGGGPMYLADIVEAVDIMGPRFCQIYGQGESPMAITALPRNLVADRSHPRWQERLASTGTAQSCVEVRVADEDGIALPAGVTGEVLVRGAAVMLGYWRNDDETAKSLRDGWLWTGDLGVLDEDGFLTLKDRSKDVIISGGSNIYPREVEEILLTHPAVHECAVVGRQSENWGEEVVAFVTASSNQEPLSEELDRLCLDNIARFKRPKEYFILPELPKNNYGKVLKTKLRQKLLQPERGFGQ
jgi:acyl-CoA synthetase (AMP-forming)/AMP-acid ligase II